MIRDESPRLAIGIALGLLLAANAHAQALEPKAVDLLKGMSARLAAAKTMTFTAVASYESPTHLGPPLVYTTLSDVTLQRPDKLRVITTADGPASEFYLDGKNMMSFSPAESFVAVSAAPPTIDAALKLAFDSAAIYFPFTDVIVADPYGDLSGGLKDAMYIGQSKVVGGTTTDMVAIVDDKIFMQIWIGAEDKLPRRLRAVYLDDPARLRHDLELSKWRLDGPIPAGTFTSAAAGKAKKIPFARPDPKPPAGLEAAEKGEAPKTPESK